MQNGATQTFHGPSTDLRLLLEPLFVKYGVQVVFAGHEHVYERVKPQNGICYFTEGASDLGKAKSVLVEVGEGSTDVALLSGGELQQSGTFPLGSIRLRAAVSAGPAKHEQQIRLLQ